MSLYKENPNHRVMVFIDYRNLSECMSAVSPNLGLDLYRLTDVLVSNRELVGAYVFDATWPYPGKDDDNVKLHNSLRKQGFRLVVTNSMNRLGGKVVQKETDVSLACEMVEHALLDHYDVAIVVSGDRDFVPAMQKVQAAGKRVEVAAFEDVYNEECKRVADIYYLLDDIPFLILSNPSDAGEGPYE